MSVSWLIVAGMGLAIAAPVVAVAHARASERREQAGAPWSKGWLAYGAETAPQPCTPNRTLASEHRDVSRVAPSEAAGRLAAHRYPRLYADRRRQRRRI
jgi:hypothetical protein